MTPRLNTDIDTRPLYQIVYDVAAEKNPTREELIDLLKGVVIPQTVTVYCSLLVRSGFLYISPTQNRFYRAIRPAKELTSQTMQEVIVTNSRGEFMSTETSKSSAVVVTPSQLAATQTEQPPARQETQAQKMVLEGSRPVVVEAAYTIDIGGLQVQLNQTEVRLLKQQLDNVVNM